MKLYPDSWYESVLTYPSFWLLVSFAFWVSAIYQAWVRSL